MPRATYVGGGDWLPGVPARDLTAAEYKKYRKLIAANTAAMGRPLYEAEAKLAAPKQEG